MEDQSAGQVSLDVKLLVQMSAVTASPILHFYDLEKHLKQVSLRSSILVYHPILL